MIVLLLIMRVQRISYNIKKIMNEVGQELDSRLSLLDVTMFILFYLT